MELPQLTESLNAIQSLPDNPAIESDELKRLFDLNANVIKEYVNVTLLPQLNTVLTNLQNKDITLEQAINTVSSTLSTATANITTIQNTLAGLKSGATTKITIGSSVPSSLSNGEVYLQYF